MNPRDMPASARTETGARRDGSPPPRKLARFTQAAFWFFLIKGLLWLTVPLAAGWFGWQRGSR